jgi:hypothetical protein
MSMKSKLLMMIAPAALAGCMMNPTPYQPIAYAGGYKDTHIRDNVYYITFKGNGFTDSGTVVQYFHRRAKELCVEKGFRDYHVLAEKDSSSWTAVAASAMEKPAYGGQIECVY